MVYYIAIQGVTKLLGKISELDSSSQIQQKSLIQFWSQMYSLLSSEKKFSKFFNSALLKRSIKSMILLLTQIDSKTNTE